MTTIPVIIKRIDGIEYAVFPTLATSHIILMRFYSIHNGFEEKEQRVMYEAQSVEFEYREQMLKVLANIGLTNLRYYSKVRDWMHRDRRLAIERIRNKVDTNQGS